MVRHLPWPNCYNIRDIGGYPTADGKIIRWRTVVRADNVSNLTDEGRAALYAYGIRTIIDLRHAHEVARMPHPFGPGCSGGYDVDYFNIRLPEERRSMIAGSLQLAFSSTRLYRQLLDVGRNQLVTIMQSIANARDGGVLIHCQMGKDRTGVACALLLALLGVPYPTIAEDYALSAVFLKAFYDQRLAQHSTPHRERLYLRFVRQFPCEPDMMLATLAYLDKHYGGVQAYLRDGGLPEQTLLDLRERLIET